MNINLANGQNDTINGITLKNYSVPLDSAMVWYSETKGEKLPIGKSPKPSDKQGKFILLFRMPRNESVLITGCRHGYDNVSLRPHGVKELLSLKPHPLVLRFTKTEYSKSRIVNRKNNMPSEFSSTGGQPIVPVQKIDTISNIHEIKNQSQESHLLFLNKDMRTLSEVGKNNIIIIWDRINEKRKLNEPDALILATKFEYESDYDSALYVLSLCKAIQSPKIQYEKGLCFFQNSILQQKSQYLDSAEKYIKESIKSIRLQNDIYKLDTIDFISNNNILLSLIYIKKGENQRADSLLSTTHDYLDFNHAKNTLHTDIHFLLASNNKYSHYRNNKKEIKVEFRKQLTEARRTIRYINITYDTINTYCAWLYCQCANIYLAHNKLNKAKKLYLKSYRINKKVFPEGSYDQIEPLYKLAGLLSKKKSLKYLNEVQKLQIRLIGIDTSLCQYYYEQGLIMQRAGLMEQSFNTLNDALECSKINGNISIELQSRIYLALANILNTKYFYYEARKINGSISDFDPNSRIIVNSKIITSYSKKIIEDANVPAEVRAEISLNLYFGLWTYHSKKTTLDSIIFFKDENIKDSYGTMLNKARNLINETENPEFDRQSKRNKKKLIHRLKKQYPQKQDPTKDRDFNILINKIAYKNTDLPIYYEYKKK